MCRGDEDREALVRFLPIGRGGERRRRGGIRAVRGSSRTAGRREPARSRAAPSRARAETTCDDCQGGNPNIQH